MSAPGTAEPAAAAPGLEAAAVTDVGTEREHNEDACAVLVEGGDCAVAVVADGVSSSAGGEVASRTAVEALLRAYRGEPPSLAPGQRLYRAVQQANIEVYDKSVVVPELRGMATTLTALAVAGGELTAVHVGDSRLYLLRGGEMIQLTKDHTVAAEKVRLGILGRERARAHPDRSVLTRSLGRELIVSRDRITRRVGGGDALLLCSDGLYNVLADAEMASLLEGRDAAAGCRALVDAANQRGTGDNLTASVVRLGGPPPEPEPAAGIAAALRGLFRRGG